MSSVDKKRTTLRGVQQTTLLGWKRRNVTDDTSETKRMRHEKSSIGMPSINNTPTNLRWENKSLPNGPMLLLRDAIGGKSSERTSTKNVLATLPDWNDNVTFQIFGKECRMRRRICQYSTDGTISYSYSGLKNVCAPNFPEAVYRIKQQVEDLMLNHLLTDESAKTSNNKHLIIPPEFMTELKAIKESKESTATDNRKEIFNYCLLNHYRNGEEYMGYHADDESSLDPRYPIASVSLGSTRSFDIRPRKKDDAGKKSRVERISLGDGDLLVMFPNMQDHYEHGIPVEKRVAGDRINLTFRRVLESKMTRH